MSNAPDTQIFRIYIQATPEAIWEAITSPEWTERYGYKGRTEYELRPGGSVVSHATKEMIDFGAPAIMVKGEVLEAELPHLTRFGVMKHLKVLEEADLIITEKVGREKLHYLNPVPIRLLHDRWIDKFTERRVSALVDLKHQLEKKKA